MDLVGKKHLRIHQLSRMYFDNIVYVNWFHDYRVYVLLKMDSLRRAKRMCGGLWKNLMYFSVCSQG